MKRGFDRVVKRGAVAILCVALAQVGSGCVVVKPWERETLARDDMAWNPDALEAALRAHVYFSKEASLQGSGAGGGGCGCN